MGRIFGLVLVLLGVGTIGGGIATAIYARSQETQVAEQIQDQLGALDEAVVILADARATLASAGGMLTEVGTTIGDTGPLLDQSVKLMRDGRALAGPLLDAGKLAADDMVELVPKARPLIPKNNLVQAAKQMLTSIAQARGLLKQLQRLTNDVDAMRPHVDAIGASLKIIRERLSAIEAHFPKVADRLNGLRGPADAAALAQNLVRAAYAVAALLFLLGLALLNSGVLWLRAPSRA